MSVMYQLWDKVSPVITPAGNEYTAEEWAKKYPWIRKPGAEMVITKGEINGGRADNLNMLKIMYQTHGLEIPEGATPQEILDLIEDWELHPKTEEAPEPLMPSTEERIAAALEAQVMLSMPDVEETETPVLSIATLNARTRVATGEAPAEEAEEEHSAGYARVAHNYSTGLWNTQLVRIAVLKGMITEAERQQIVNS